MADDPKDPTVAGDALVRLRAPEGATGCSWNGVEYPVDKKGRVAVPEAAIGALMAHGFATLGGEP